MRAPVLCLAALAAAVSVTPTSAQTVATEVTNDAGTSLLRLNTDAGLVVAGTADAGTIPVQGEGVRMMWYPGRYAFRAGRVGNINFMDGRTFWDTANVGAGSAAFGTNNQASGTNAFAAGVNTFASGENAFAFNGTASGSGAVAFNGTASGSGAVAIGSGAQATGDNALSMGPSSVANGTFGVAIGRQNRADGTQSLALGRTATAFHQGSIVISDGSARFSSDSLTSARNNDFSLRAVGGVRIFTTLSTQPSDQTQGGPYAAYAGVRIAPGGGSWTSISDRNQKENVATVDGEALLGALRGVPVTTWNYIAEGDSVRHMGPMAQDFHAAFGLNGADSLGINTVDIDGVMLAGVQALDARTRALADENAALRSRLDALAAENAALQAERAVADTRLARLEAALSPPTLTAGSGH